MIVKMESRHCSWDRSAVPCELTMGVKMEILSASGCSACWMSVEISRQLSVAPSCGISVRRWILEAAVGIIGQV